MTARRGIQYGTYRRKSERNNSKGSKDISEMEEVTLDNFYPAESIQVERSEDDLDFDYDDFDFSDVEEYEISRENRNEEEEFDDPEENLGEEEFDDFEENLDANEDLERLEEEDIINRFKPCNVPSKTRQITAMGSGVTIVKANTGNRIVLHHSIVSALGITTNIQFGYSELSSQLMIGRDLPNDFIKYNVKLQKNQSATIYNKNLVTVISSTFNLDFNNCKSKTFSSWKVVTQNNFDVVLVDIC